MKFYTLFILLSINIYSTQAQTKNKFELNFEALYNQQKLQLDSVQYVLPNATDSVTITNLKFYVSNICLLNNGKKVYIEKNSYHLIDITNNKGLAFMLNIAPTLRFNTIEFNIGIDSATNNKGVLGNDLDPTKGMYWAWHSGYINFKLEGKSKLCATRNNVFQFHLGGYQFPNNSLQKINLNIANKNKATVAFDVYKFLNKVDIKTINEIMTPSKEAVELSKSAAAIFGIKSN